ncbi:MAG: DUF2066 domain-containing protein [Sneathiella sp.]|nr:DUF2066 domain-containing protein [Sneathiella sp.]
MIILIFLVLAAVTAPRAATNLYVVRGISVDETAASASQARTVAVRNGQARAFRTLLRRLVPAPYHNSLPVLDEDAIAPLVASFQVANERSSDTRYLADLTFEFKRGDIRRLLRANMLPFSESVGRPLLILPVYQEGNRSFLWEEPNPWRTVWVDIIDFGVRPQEPEDLRDDWAQLLLQPVIVPAGDLQDMKSINVSQAVNLDDVALKKLAADYGAEDVLVITASVRTGIDGLPLLDVREHHARELAPAVIETYKGSDDAETLMQSVVFELLTRIQENWKRKNVLDFSVENTLAVTTEISSLQDWLDIQKKVAGLSAVSATRIKDLSVTQVYWYITFLGGMDQLVASLAQQDLDLVEQGGYWMLDRKKKP